MARRIILATPIEGSSELVEAGELGGAPFALMVETLPPQRGLLGKTTYRIKLQIKLRDEDVEKLIRKHKLLDVVVHSDGAAEGLHKQQSELVGDIEKGLQAWNVLKLATAAWQYGGKKYAEAKAVEITFGRLLHVVEIAGATVDEVTFVAYQVRSNIDTLAMKIAAAESFEGDGEVRVFIPGEKKKPVKTKPGTPASQWRR